MNQIHVWFDCTISQLWLTSSTKLTPCEGTSQRLHGARVWRLRCDANLSAGCIQFLKNQLRIQEKVMTKQWSETHELLTWSPCGWQLRRLCRASDVCHAARAQNHTFRWLLHCWNLETKIKFSYKLMTKPIKLTFLNPRPRFLFRPRRLSLRWIRKVGPNRSQTRKRAALCLKLLNCHPGGESSRRSAQTAGGQLEHDFKFWFSFRINLIINLKSQKSLKSFPKKTFCAPKAGPKHCVTCFTFGAKFFKFWNFNFFKNHF